MTAIAHVPEHVRCRTLGHAWDDIPVTRPPEFGAAIDLRCIHCYTLRRDIVSRFSGRLLSRSYTYPDGYKDSGDDRPNRQDYRVMWIGHLPQSHLVIGDGDDPDEDGEQPPLRIVGGKRSRPARQRKSA